MTIKEARALCAAVGCSLRSIPEAGEYRVNLLGSTEATAYYATDLDDAVNTARAMAQHAGLVQFDSNTKH